MESDALVESPVDVNEPEDRLLRDPSGVGGCLCREVFLIEYAVLGEERGIDMACSCDDLLIFDLCFEVDIGFTPVPTGECGWYTDV